MALLFLGGACSPSSNVKAGAPVLTSLTIVEPDGTPHGTRWDVTADTQNCPTEYAEGKDCDPGPFAVCELDKNVVCHCVAKDMCDPSIKPDAAATLGTLNCTYAPGSMVIATFDRLLDTTPFDGMQTVASLAATPTTAAVAATDYTSSGTSTGLVFTQWSAFTGNFFADITGPTIAMTGTPALPVDSTVTFSLTQDVVRAKDGKTSFTGAGPLLTDGKIAFKTSSFTASITVPAPPPPMDMGGSMMMSTGCPGMMMPEMDAGAGDAGSDGGVADGGASDAGASADAGMMTMTTPPSTDVPADMNMGAVTITFSNPVDATILDHIKFTEDGQAFTDVAVTMPDKTMMMDFPVTTVGYAPKTAWAAGKTYTVTVDSKATDVLGKTMLGMDVSQSFTMAK
jgi:hypothetical protein